MNPKDKSLLDWYSTIYKDFYEGSVEELEIRKEMVESMFKSFLHGTLDFGEEITEDEEDEKDEVYEMESFEGKTIEDLLNEGKSFHEIQRMYNKNRFKNS